MTNIGQQEAILTRHRYANKHHCLHGNPIDLQYINLRQKHLSIQAQACLLASFPVSVVLMYGLLLATCIRQNKTFVDSGCGLVEGAADWEG